MRKIFQRFKVRETLVMISCKIAHLSFTLLPFLPINQTYWIYQYGIQVWWIILNSSENTGTRFKYFWEQKEWVSVIYKYKMVLRMLIVIVYCSVYIMQLNPTSYLWLNLRGENKRRSSALCPGGGNYELKSTGLLDSKPNPEIQERHTPCCLPQTLYFQSGR